MIPRREIERYMVPLSPLPTGLRPAGTARKPVHCVLFDIYGTLFLSAAGDRHRNGSREEDDALASLLHREGVSQSPARVKQAFWSEIAAVHEEGRSAGIDRPEVEYDRIWRKVLGTRDAAFSRRFAVEFEWIVNPVHPSPGLRRTLEGLRAKRIALGLVSNAQFFTPWLFSWFLGRTPAGLGFEEDLQIYSYRLGCAKPSRVLFDAARRRLFQRQIEPEAVVFVGNDVRNDILCARNAGFQTALFAGDARSLRLREEDPKCRKIVPDIVVTELLQILEKV